MNTNELLKETLWENQQIDLGIERYNESLEGTPMSQQTPGQKLMQMMLPDLVSEFQTLHESIGDSLIDNPKAPWVYCMPMLDPLTTAVLCLQSVFGAVTGRQSMEVTLTTINLHTAKVFKQQVEFMRFRAAAADEENPEAKAIGYLMKRYEGQMNRSTLWRWQKKFDSYATLDWDEKVLEVLGAKLVKTCIDVHPDVFLINTIKSTKSAKNVLTLSPEIWNNLEDLHAALEIARPYYLPTIIEPKPWSNDNGKVTGGYWLHDVDLFTSGIHKHTAADHDATSLEFLTAVNRVQKTAWRINKRMFQYLQLAVYAESPRLPSAPHESSPVELSESEWQSLSNEQRTQIKAERRQWHEEQASIRGSYASFHRKLAVAELLEEHEVFYMPHFCDFRGRIYPFPQEINPQGDHWAKGLLEFAEGRPLGESGLYWLKIHVANLAGMDKATYDERIAFVDANSSKLTTSDFIETNVADDEFCTYLAAAWDLEEALSRPDPEGHVSHIPVAMDGVCNGMQILSLLGRDAVGAKATNCSSDPERQDLYSEVAAVVREKLDEDAALGLLEAMYWLDTFPENGRKIVKRAVMTTPYGVTDIGISDQLIKDKHTANLQGDPKANADYMRTCIRDAMGQVAGKAKELMAYFQECAGVLADHDLPLSWITPSNLRVTQSYWKIRRQSIATVFGNCRLPVENPRGGLDKRKNMLSAAPNVVHSLDAALLQRVALRLGSMGITDTAMIHDSYGVHASLVGELHMVIRSEALRVFNQDWLGEFHRGLCALMIDNELDYSQLPTPPQQGEFDVRDVLNAPYFFS